MWLWLLLGFVLGRRVHCLELDHLMSCVAYVIIVAGLVGVWTVEDSASVEELAALFTHLASRALCWSDATCYQLTSQALWPLQWLTAEWSRFVLNTFFTNHPRATPRFVVSNSSF